MARKKSNIHYIYKTTCLINNRFYVGMHSTINFEDGYIGSGLRLRRSIRKHGKENHKKEILCFCSNREELIAKEIEIVTTKFINDDLCMNLREGGTGGFTSQQQKLNAVKSNEKQKILKEDSEYKNNRKRIASESLVKQYEHGIRDRCQVMDRTNIKHSFETKNKMSLSKKETKIGKENHNFDTCWITKNKLNKQIKKEDLYKWEIEGWVKGYFKKSSLSEDKINEIIKLRQQGFSFKKISLNLNIAKSTIIDNLKKTNEKNI